MNDSVDSIAALIEHLREERNAYREYFLAWQENGDYCERVGVTSEEYERNSRRVKAATERVTRLLLRNTDYAGTEQ